SENNLDKYYASDNYISHTNKPNTLTNKLYKIARRFTLQRKLNLINKLQDKDTILDYGCGTGEFLNTCQNNGWQITGVEPNQVAREQANTINNNRVFPSLDSVEDKSKFKIITLWHVLEHIPQLNDTLKKLRKLLHKNGTMIVAVPNCESYDAQLYKEFWAGYDLPRHLYHFTPKTLKKLMKRHKLKVRDIIPMPLDSYYISLLSQQYMSVENDDKAGVSNYIKSIINGYKSNSYAEKHQNNHSSLMYIISK
ncbi:MAG: class I SAM-dependent methyltransferase, partial [Bacteroidota bacterium]